ncbi:hypothetical protein V6U90_12110 [Micromonospora sp. CPCC 206060]|uniref:hypothetical protein n=1 Tax=Micromonospora sp. CPCC 206060 TaxID=3122406 RepID=UPI002FF355B6
MGGELRLSARVAPHTPIQPLWLCRPCAQPWPCPTARLTLRAEYADDRIGLSVYLCGLLHAAMRDLHRLNPHDMPGPQAMYDRFVGWNRPRYLP